MNKNHIHRAITPSMNAPHAAPTLLNVERPAVSNHFHSAPTRCARGHSLRYFGNAEIDRPATHSGTNTHHGPPADPAAAVTINSQNSGTRSVLKNVGGLSSRITHHGSCPASADALQTVTNANRIFCRINTGSSTAEHITALWRALAQ